MHIYTRTGDGGETGLYGGSRRSKADQRIVAYGAVDEVQAVLGLCTAYLSNQQELLEELIVIQQDLFIVCCELSRLETKLERKDPVLDSVRITWLEQRIDAHTEDLPELRNFILQGGSVAGAQLHVARAVVRRAEREVVALSNSEIVSETVSTYMNRLSDYLFTLARKVNQLEVVQEQEIIL